MGTRSGIGLVERDASGTVTRVRGIYCHWDGYLDHNGVLLDKHYRDVATVNALLDLGDLSSLRAHVGEKHDFNDTRRDSPQETNQWTTAYGRDRGEHGTDAKVFPGPDAMAKFRGHFSRCSAEYLYLFDNERWYWSRPDGKRRLLLERSVATLNEVGT